MNKIISTSEVVKTMIKVDKEQFIISNLRISKRSGWHSEKVLKTHVR